VPDRQSIADKLASYINDFGVVAYEAERKVLSDQMRLNDIPDDDSAIMPLSTSESEIYSLSEIQPGEWVTVEVKVVSLQTPNSPSITQTGILADSSGAIRFVSFVKGSEILPLEFEQWYRIESATVDLFREIPSLKLHSGSRVTPITDDRSLMPAPPMHLNDLTPGVAASIQVKFVEEWETRSDRMLQTGLVADISGKMKFVLWKSANQERLTLGSVYNIFYANVDTFGGRLSLSLNSSMWMEDEDTDIPVPVVMPEPKEELPMTSICDLSTGYASIRVKFVDDWETRSDRMLQTGLVGDETGRIKFVLWRDEQKEKLVLGKVYLIKNAKVNEYNGRLSLVLNNAICEEDELEADIAVGTNYNTYVGTIVQISSGSGLVKRCPVKGCNRVLSHQNFCPIHEIQNNYHYDLRIKAVMDDGHKAYNVLMGREIAEALAGMTMDQAINLALESPLGFDEVQTQFMEKLYCRYVHCCGNNIEGRILMKSAEFIHLNSSKTVELMNRAGVFHGSGEQ
jgi:replication factor A1